MSANGSTERQSHTSRTLNQKLEMIQLSEKGISKSPDKPTGKPGALKL